MNVIILYYLEEYIFVTVFMIYQYYSQLVIEMNFTFLSAGIVEMLLTGNTR